jgi:hypothetical protein
MMGYFFDSKIIFAIKATIVLPNSITAIWA